MSGTWWWRTFLITLVVGYAVYYLIPSWVYFRLPPDQRNDSVLLDQKIPRWAPKRHLNLGLDLQGGIELVMGVDADKAMRDKAARRADDLKRIADEKKLPFAEIKPVVGEAQVEVVGCWGRTGAPSSSAFRRCGCRSSATTPWSRR
jgi:preprotein translocase subunit SecD